MSAGYRHSCGIRMNGELLCWGRNDDGESVPPEGTFIQVDSGVRASCALTSEGYAVCWGFPGLVAFN